MPNFFFLFYEFGFTSILGLIIHAYTMLNVLFTYFFSRKTKFYLLLSWSNMIAQFLLLLLLVLNSKNLGAKNITTRFFSLRRNAL